MTEKLIEYEKERERKVGAHLRERESNCDSICE